MLFQNGNPGKQPWTKNKESQIRKFLKDLVENNFTVILQDFAEVKPRERLQFIEGIMPYLLPKLHNIDLDAEITEKKIIINFGGNGHNHLGNKSTEAKELPTSDN